jgi:glycosyltransferase involved in cell wall biosynthesis
MKVCILAPENSASGGGVGAYTFNLAKALSSRMEVYVVSVRKTAPDPFDSSLKERCEVVYITTARQQDNLLYNSRFQMKLATFLGRFCTENEVDIVHSHSGHLPHLFSEFVVDIPIVTTVHATASGLVRGLRGSRQFGHAELWTILLAPFIKAGERLSFRQSSAIVPVSQFTENEIRTLYGAGFIAKSKVVMNAVDPTTFAPTSEVGDDSPTLLHVGRPNGVKGLAVFLELLRWMRKDFPDLQGLVAGVSYADGAPEGWREPGVRYLGRVPYDLMPQTYNRNSVVVLTSSYDNCPAAALEAMSCGKAVVAPRLGGIPEVITHSENGLLYEPGNVAELRAAVASLLSDAGRAQELGSRARRHIVRSFDWLTRTQTFDRLYRDVLGEDLAS